MTQQSSCLFDLVMWHIILSTPIVNIVWVNSFSILCIYISVRGLWLAACTELSEWCSWRKRKRESTRRRGLSLFPHILVQEANTSWHPWNPFLICWLKVMGREREWWRKVKKRRGSTAGVLCVQNQLQFENDPLRGFFLSVVGTSFGPAEKGIQPWCLCKSLFLKQTCIIYCKVGAHITYQKPC